MAQEKSKRVELNPSQQGLAGLANVLAGFDTSSLPSGPSQPPPSPEPPKTKRHGRVILRRETAHRGGRTVIVVHDFPPSMPQSALEQLAKDLRHAIGTGGTVSERTIEIQGDQPGKVRTFLEKLGYQVAGVS